MSAPRQVDVDELFDALRTVSKLVPEKAPGESVDVGVCSTESHTIRITLGRDRKSKHLELAPREAIGLARDLLRSTWVLEHNARELASAAALRDALDGGHGHG